ncbi:MAG: hypothetical protein JWP74_67 [Marmoricola sp.]|nr:hypothetical protein [Marmoricola sp.]
MKILTVRRAGVVAVASMIATMAPGVAATGNLSYPCSVEGNDSGSFTINADTNAPASVPKGTALTPTLTSRITFPAAFISGLKSQGGFTKFNKSTVVTTVLTNGTSSTVSQSFPAKNFPASGSMTVVATGKMHSFTPTTAGAVAYVPGNVTMTLQPGFALDTTCTVPSSPPSIDTVTVTDGGTPPPPPPPPAKIATSTTEVVKYSAAHKTVKIAAVVKPVSGAAPTGKVTFSIVRAGKVLRSGSKALVKGKASIVFKHVKKGGAKVIATYAGSSKSKGSKKTIVVRLH